MKVAGLKEYLDFNLEWPLSLDGIRAGDGRAGGKDVDVKTHVLHPHLEDQNAGPCSALSLSLLASVPISSVLAMPVFVR